MSGQGDGRVLVFAYHGMYLFMPISEAPSNFRKLDNQKIVGKKVKFKPISIIEDKVVISNQAIMEYYEKALAHQNIISGRVKEVKEGKTPYTYYAIVISKGDTIIIPSSQFAHPETIAAEDMIGKIIDFVMIGINDDKLIGSTKVVSDYRKERLKYFKLTGEPFKAKVQKLENFGAYLTYKNNVSVILRNRDFSSNYTCCKDVLDIGDRLDVVMKEITPSNKFMVELPVKYNALPSIDFDDIQPEQQYEAEIVRVEPFGAFTRIGVGRDVLCPINFEKREPLINDKVLIEIVVSNKDLGRLRGKIIKYQEELPDLSSFNLKGDNYDY